MAIYICLLLPIEIAFHPKWGHSVWWLASEYTIEGFFCLDVLAHFNTSFYDHDGNEEFSRLHIAQHYLTSFHFWIDMLATIPIPIVKLFIMSLQHRNHQLLKRFLLLKLLELQACLRLLKEWM